jgi:hypothetical protein
MCEMNETNNNPGVRKFVVFFVSIPVYIILPYQNKWETNYSMCYLDEDDILTEMSIQQLIRIYVGDRVVIDYALQGLRRILF